MAQKRILCVGNAVLDQIYLLDTLPTGPGKHYANGYLESGGGPAATASVAVSRLGGYARLWSRIGDDPAGDRIVAGLEGFGVDLTGLVRQKGVVSSLAGLQVDKTGERISVNFIDPKMSSEPDWMPLEQMAGFDCALGDIRWPKGTGALLKAAAQYGKPSVLDADRAPSKDILDTLAPLASHPVFSEHGLLHFTGESAPEAGLLKAASLIKGTPYVTLGDKGCMWYEDGKIHHCPAFKVDVVDTTGAGDVFHGAFALALAEGMPSEKAVRFASGTSALKCTKAGGRAGIPDRKTLEEFLASR